MFFLIARTMDFSYDILVFLPRKWNFHSNNNLIQNPPEACRYSSDRRFILSICWMNYIWNELACFACNKILFRFNFIPSARIFSFFSLCLNFSRLIIISQQMLNLLVAFNFALVHLFAKASANFSVVMEIICKTYRAFRKILVQEMNKDLSRNIYIIRILSWKFGIGYCIIGIKVREVSKFILKFSLHETSKWNLCFGLGLLIERASDTICSVYSRDAQLVKMDIFFLDEALDIHFPAENSKISEKMFRIKYFETKCQQCWLSTSGSSCISYEKPLIFVCISS